MKTSIFKTTIPAILILFYCSITTAARWQEYTSENFRVYSDLKQKEVIKLINNFETFRKAALIYANLDPRKENIRARIFILNRKADYKKIGPENSLGFYRDSWDGPIMVVQGKSYFLSKNSILYHEYFHYLLRERSELYYPKWYDEGFAEVLSTADVDSDAVSIGGMPELRAYRLNAKLKHIPIKLEKFLIPTPPEKKKDQDEYWASFYAQAWLMTHYIQLGVYSGYPDYSPALRKYILAINNGEDPISSFPKHFGRSIEEFSKELVEYKNQKYINGFKFSVTPYTGGIKIRAFSDNEGYYHLANLAWESGNEEYALKTLKKTRKTKENAAANIALSAILENHKEGIDSKHLAKEHARKAQTLGINSAESYRDLAHYYYDVIETSRKNNTQEKDAYKQLISYATKAIELDPSLISAYSFLWQGHALMGDRIEALKVMVAAFKIYPENIRLNYELGAYIANGEEADAAIPLLEKVIKTTHNQELQKSAEDILKRIREQSN